jgi:hypothetical protein
MLTNNLFKKYNPREYALDEVGGCVGAWSVFKLKLSSTLCMRVRRSIDDAEIDIGFRNGFVDFDTIKHFASGGSAYISIWYNQVIGGNNAIQPTASFQPRILNGSVIDLNGAFFDGSDDRMRILDYDKLNITNNPLGIYLNIVPGALASNYVFARNSTGTSTRQYSAYTTSGTLNFQLNGSSRASRYVGYGLNEKILIRWYNNNIEINSPTGKNDTSYSDLTLSNYTNNFIGGLSSAADGSSVGSVWSGNIKTIMIFDKKISDRGYEILKKVA